VGFLARTLGEMCTIDSREAPKCLHKGSNLGPFDSVTVALSVDLPRQDNNAVGRGCGIREGGGGESTLHIAD
jgi:hypothetical protein